MEAIDHGPQERFRPELFKIHRMPGALGKDNKKRQLRSPVTVTKGVDGIERCQKLRGCAGERVERLIGQKLVLPQHAEQPGHLARDMLRIAVASAHSHGSKTPRPALNILEEMPMKGPVMAYSERAAGQWFICALRCHRRGKAVEPGLVADCRNVLQDCRGRVAVRVRDGAVHVRQSSSHICARELPDARSPVNCAGRNCENLRPFQRSDGSFDRADLREAPAPQNKALRCLLTDRSFHGVIIPCQVIRGIHQFKRARRARRRRAYAHVVVVGVPEGGVSRSSGSRRRPRPTAWVPRAWARWAAKRSTPIPGARHWRAPL